MDALTPKAPRRGRRATVTELEEPTSIPSILAAGGLPQLRSNTVVISPPNFQEAVVRIEGTAPYCMNKMSSENRWKIIEKQMKGEQSRKGQRREPKDFDKIYKGTMHIAAKGIKSGDKGGWYGIPAAAFRNAMVSACRVVGFKMTIAKLCLFVVHDGIDEDDGQPLIKLQGTPKRRDMAVKLADGSTDILPRAFFDTWHADVRLRWDADQFSASDVMNLLSRVGVQVGIGAGRPDSRNSTGMGWGTFQILNGNGAGTAKRRKAA